MDKLFFKVHKTPQNIYMAQKVLIFLKSLLLQNNIKHVFLLPSSLTSSYHAWDINIMGGILIKIKPGQVLTKVCPHFMECQVSPYTFNMNDKN